MPFDAILYFYNWYLISSWTQMGIWYCKSFLMLWFYVSQLFMNAEFLLFLGLHSLSFSPILLIQSLLYCNTNTLNPIFLTWNYSWISLIFSLHKFCHLDLLHVLVSVDEAGHVGSANICVWRGMNCRCLTMNLQVKWWHRHRNSWCVGQRVPPASWVLCLTQMSWTLLNLTFLLFLRCVCLHICT